MLFEHMTSARLATLAGAWVVLICPSFLKADEIEVQFAATISMTTAPDLYVGESFTGEFTYSTTDPLETSIGGVNSYALVSSEDSLSVSVASLNLSFALPPSGATAIVGQAPVYFDTNPNQNYFAIQDFSNPGMSIQLVGDPNFFSSDALPDPFNAFDITLGSSPGLTSNVGFDFGGYATEGDLTQISTVPEPRELEVACLGMASIFGLFLRRSLTASRS